VPVEKGDYQDGGVVDGFPGGGRAGASWKAGMGMKSEAICPWGGEITRMVA